MDKLNDKKQTVPFSRYLIIFALSIAVGYYAKMWATNYTSIGFEDWKITTASSEYNFTEIEKKVEQLKEEQAAAAEQEAAENNAVNRGGATEGPSQCAE
ncbi:MAG: hypothetical protein U9Q72_03805 [Patescibacteria group bacterium]|nr:hypothetical protein [Patescibacteria group bacterium]